MNFRRDERGVVAVELAFVLPILVLLLFGIVECAITYNRAQALHAAAREGARVASQSYATSGEIEARVRDALEPISFANPVAVVISPSSGRPCNLRTGAPVTVSVTVDDEVDIPLWPSSPMTVTLEGKGEFRCE
ncbi:MAG: pilus assembly protein [Actinobacteria bacterium]|nr:pilus assembly protein [Actinomycetota bacterium]